MGGHSWFGAAGGQIEIFSCLYTGVCQLTTRCNCLLSDAQNLAIVLGVCVCGGVQIMLIITVKREQEGFSGALLRYKFWHVPPHTHTQHSPSFSFTHLHTHTLRHGWYHLHLQPTHSKVLSGGTQATALSYKHTQKHRDARLPGNGWVWDSESDSISAYWFWCVKNIGFNSKKNTITSSKSKNTFRHTAFSHLADIVFILADVRSRAYIFFCFVLYILPMPFPVQTVATHFHTD